jgi:choline dehydrogenase-like flavoprotein
MLIDARELPPDSPIEADLMIVGGGIAGIAMAREFGQSGIDVCILESGGEEPEPEVQELYAGKARMHGAGNDSLDIDDYLTSSRFRYLGGSGNAWGGKCVPLDSADFTGRDWVPGSGWPLTRRELQPFYDRACDLFDICHFPLDPSAHWTEERPAVQLGDAGLQSLPRCFTRCTGASRDNTYGAFKASVTDSARTRVYLYANVRNIRLRKDGSAVESLEVVTLDGRRHEASARCYVLATGGIENARLLLASNDIAPGGVGNDSDLVGRFFQGHVTLGMFNGAAGRNSSMFLTQLDQPFDLYVDGDRSRVQAVLGPNWEAQKKDRLRNCTLTPFNAWYEAHASSKAIMDTSFLLDRKHGQLEQGAVDTSHFAFFFMVEQAPNEQSRITLTDRRDRLGMPRVQLDWDFSEQDFEELDRAVAFFRRELGRTAHGRLEWPVFREELIGNMSASRHHNGSTRMNESPARGVVDPDCRLHNVSNLYVAGSSVFPTGGIANPTLTLVALAMRLSDHLKLELRG